MFVSVVWQKWETGLKYEMCGAEKAGAGAAAVQAVQRGLGKW